MVLDSCKNVAAPQVFAARIAGALMNPPIPSTACGGRERKSLFAARNDFKNPAQNFAGCDPLKPPGGCGARDTPPGAFALCGPPSWAKTSTLTSQPRGRISGPRASPEKRCPPVPPQAMAIRGFGLRIL